VSVACGASLRSRPAPSSAFSRTDCIRLQTAPGHRRWSCVADNRI